MNILRSILRKIGHQLSIYLTKPRRGPADLATSDPELLVRCLQPGDVLLIDTNSRAGGVIKFLTQSGWSHAALYLGPEKTLNSNWDGSKVLLEVDVAEGVRLVTLSEYAHLHTRICRPVGLSAATIDQVLNYAMDRLGHSYDLKNIFDLARYLVVPTPVPSRWRRSLLAFGSGDPTRAICSSLIAQAFQSVHYPILPNIRYQKSLDRNGQAFRKQILKIRHHSLFVPRDFDVSPYFQIIKPQIEAGFDPMELDWEDSG